MVLIKETIAMVLIGDAVLGLARPQRHVARWQIGPFMVPPAAGADASPRRRRARHGRLVRRPAARTANRLISTPAARPRRAVGDASGPAPPDLAR